MDTIMIGTVPMPKENISIAPLRIDWELAAIPRAGVSVMHGRKTVSAPSEKSLSRTGRRVVIWFKRNVRL